MAIWKHSRWDAVLLLLSIAQLAVMIGLVCGWKGASWSAWSVNVMVLALMATYNIIVISHFFTHTPWFSSVFLNGCVSLLNSVNIGQSVQAYHLTHVRNHHRYNNDQGKSGLPPNDTSSTFVGGKKGKHVGLVQYAFYGAAVTLFNCLLAVGRAVCFVGIRSRAVEAELNYSRDGLSRARETAQLHRDRLAQAVALIILLWVAWDWVLLCYLPALYIAFAIVNIQNYYEHYGADPDDRFANSVSYYGRFYNFLAFNDGHHQEHHLAPTAHWRMLPALREKHAAEMAARSRVISPVPAVIGFMDRKRPMLHKEQQ